MSFAERSKYLRKEKGLSQVELAKALNISKACISMIEIGKNEPTAITLIKYADFFQCSVDYLLERTDESTEIIKSNFHFEISKNEKDFLILFRSLSHENKNTLSTFMTFLHSQEKE